MPDFRDARWLFASPFDYYAAKVAEAKTAVYAPANDRDDADEDAERERERVPLRRAYSVVRATFGPLSPGKGAEPGVAPPSPAPVPALLARPLLAVEDPRVTLLRKLGSRDLPLSERRKLEPKADSSIFTQTSFIIMMVRGGGHSASRRATPLTSLPPVSRPRVMSRT